MSLLKLLASSNYIPLNKQLIKIFGIEEALILGELCSEYEYWVKEDKLKDDMFFCSVSKLEEHTTLSEYQQRKAIKKLEDIGIIKTVLKGVPATRYFCIDENKLFSFLRTSSEKTKELVPEKLRSSNNLNNKNINNNKLSISKDIDNKEKFHFGTSTSKTSNSMEIDKFADLYNEHCFNLSKLSKLTDNRIKAIKKLLKNYTYEEIITVFDNANNSEFLKGNNDRGWKANIDFILREDKFVNILEGRYNSKPKLSKQISSDMNNVHKSMTAEQKRQFKEDIASGRAKKY